ncbi:divergent polysaccharide deacetylase family protein [Kordiimonas pumila]|uniref:Divergent polysaccharide deacetylase family protein n=1 Tax=Kordiimonas pumila TaxID=2161677 RepID=A0ABV7D1R1_9PROT|nr:divergent polysaccharide deacetylase family protein [Kordiimonas pumila]
MRKSSLIKAAIIIYSSLIIIIGGALFYILETDEYASVELPIAPTDPVVSDLELQEQVQRIQGTPSVAIKRPEHLDESEQQTNHVQPVMSTWQKNAAHWDKAAGPKIAIVIDDLGLAEDASFALAEMEGPYTLSFLPYAEHLEKQTHLVKKAGHELFVHMPMEPKTDADPGPHALLVTLTPSEFEQRVDWNLSRFEGFVGVNNHMGSLMTEQAAPMVRLMVHLSKGGFVFLDSLTSPDSVAERAALATGVPVLSRDIFLDNERTMQAILEQLVKTERIAQERGYAIAIGHPYDETLKALEFWRAGLKAKNINLVPISEIYAEELAKVEKHAAHQGHN